ncbi:pentraxin-4 isoform X2 [Echeneis naucrates]|uniref:pentraxin-4 isoform X2 n=1 Tax=Echeneis naucrates TaxID=173247 RepID=UPI0011136AC5|nr:pentraxin-4 isoform X2 [Echeneis naucrates]
MTKREGDLTNNNGKTFHLSGGDQRAQLFLSQLYCTMGSLKPAHWPLILVHMLLPQLQCVKVPGMDPVSQKLRRLNEQFQQFQALTQARLDMLALNQNRNSSQELKSHVQNLNEYYHHMSQDLEHLKQSTTQEVEGLREWSKRLEKKSKRMENRLALIERNLRENHRHSQKEKSDLGWDFSNLTLELQSQEERLGVFQSQHNELLLGLKGLQESSAKQALRVAQLEGQLADVLQLNRGGNIRSLPQEYYEPHGRAQTHRRARPGRILAGQSRPEGTSQINTDQPKLNQYHETNELKHSKTQRTKPQPRSRPQIQDRYSNPKPESTESLPEPDSYHSQSEIQFRARSWQEQVPSKQSVPAHDAQIHHQNQQSTHPQLHPQRHHQLHNPNYSSWPGPTSQSQTHPEPNRDWQSRTRIRGQASDVLPQPPSESYQSMANRWKTKEVEGRDTKVETSVIHNLLQLPVRHKIPARPVPKKHATICNVDSMLFFPSASVENYVTFSQSLPSLPELSACLWLRVESTHIGTLLSYATDDKDNQLVLYGRNLSTSSKASSSPSASPYPSAPSPSLDFVIGDPAYRRLPTSLLLDSGWHHLCVVWSSIQGRFWYYSDRRLITSGSNFRKGWEIPGGGSVVLGQEQDTVGGGFDSAEGFAGQVAGFRVWNRVLSPSEVEGVAAGRGVPRGVVLDMEDIKEVHGEVQQVVCECLEHCL